MSGHLHPISHVNAQIRRIFAGIGFSIASGPEIETEFYNFDALNIPGDHPARDMWDTFWLKPEHARKLLRTHTSPVQVRYLESHQPPLRIIAPGKVFRHEATDATHEAQFYQLEGLAIDTNITVGHLKHTLERFFGAFFDNPDTTVRLRPSYFPFVEPGLEIDVTCFKCKGAGCSMCKGTGWIEIAGAGMVHPKVLQASGVDSSKWQGFAFGAGIDRLAMLKYGIDDVRLLYSGDLRVVNQF